MTKQFTQSELNKVLWDAADSSRSSVDAGIYKDYALTMLFFKYLSDKSKAEHAKLKERYGDDAARIDAKMKTSRFYLPPNSSFDQVYARKEEDNIGEIINIALKTIEAHNKAKLEGVFSVDFNSESILGRLQTRNKMLRHLLNDFHKIDLSDIGEDIIGNSYMYMIEKFGADAGKKAGEFFTVTAVAELVARLARPKPGDRIADPAAGSGGLLLLAGEEIRKQGSNNFALYGQEATGSTYQLCRMNMFLHGMDSAHIEWGDTLNNPLLVESDGLMHFDVTVANPPFSLKKWGAENAENDPYKRFWRGVPPKDKGDYAFVTHMIETLKPKTGRMAVIVPHGVLFRGGAEGKIRQQLIEENIIDAVIGLPAGLFQTTGIPVAVLIIDRAREVGGARQDDKDILFIEASKEFKPGKAQNTLTQENADKIFNTFIERKEIEKFSHIANIDEIKENDYNLNITRYVDTFEEEEEIDIAATIKAIDEINPKLDELEQQMKRYLKDLGIS
ncbi:type I restriction-modification system subunit M [Candidatus Saccharibacteria bacterium]|nr:type I restriction-modification system subunit M [Candidatus Saccharibacteria bacterium]MBH1973264.1 type I restriction-modification system subunit M [Candidatus Saccharibacteria bacterium]MBH1990495.1 type I restriction-modification system subunit M [Candidatus Saccharibacteria bacterium]